MKYILLLLFLGTCCFDTHAFTLGPVTLEQEHIGPAMQAFIALTILSLAPGILMMLTAFTRIVVVLSMLRTALGLQQTPPNSVLISLALFLTFFTMMPVGETIYEDAYLPYQQQKINLTQALSLASEPLKKFMLRQTHEQDIQLILELAHKPITMNPASLPLYQLIPAFMLSELQTAFQITFILFLPFLLIDLIVSGILMTAGMMMVPPMSISLPVKILIFVLIDGWTLITQSLITGFQ